LSFNDFELVLGESYFIKSSTESSWSIEGYIIVIEEIAIPHTDGYSAESLCDEIISQGVIAVEVDRWHNGEGHICGLRFNDFAIERGRGYFVKSNSSGTVTPTAIYRQAQDLPPFTGKHKTLPLPLNKLHKYTYFFMYNILSKTC
jgi:hypothetical protein